MSATVYCNQTDISWENPALSHERVTEQIHSASPEANSLIVLPEMFATGFSMNSETVAESSAESETFARNLAITYRSFVLAGIAVKVGESCANLAIAWNPGGEVVCRYQKMHPFSLAKEHEVYAAGNEIALFEWQGFRVCPLICYDLRFPEVFRLGTAAGAEIFPVIANWPSARTSHWVSLLHARAIENLAYVVGVNRCGSDPKFSYDGCSQIIDPHGSVLADAGNSECVIRSVLDRELLTNWRAEFPALKDVSSKGTPLGPLFHGNTLQSETSSTSLPSEIF